MKKKIKFKIKDVVPDEHLRFIVKNTTPYQRMKWLEEAWNTRKELLRVQAAKKPK